MNKTKLMMGAAALLIMPATAQAQDGFYVSGSIGYSETSDINAAPTSPGPLAAGVNVETEGDVAFTGAVGYAFDFAGPLDPRVEFEYSYRENDADDIAINGNDVSANGPIGGAFEVQTFMVNAIVDYDLGNRIKPYVGVGVGLANIDSDAGYLNGAGVQFNLDGSETVFAAQGIIGASYEVTDKVDFFADARYLATQNIDVDRVNAAGATTDFETDFDIYTISAGVRYKF